MLHAQTPAGGAWSRVRDGTCQEGVGHERGDNKRESGRGDGEEGSNGMIRDTRSPIKSGEGGVDVNGERDAEGGRGSRMEEVWDEGMA